MSRKTVYATILVRTERQIRSDLEWDVFGFSVGEKCGIAVPCLTGTAKPNTTQLCKLDAAMNTGGSVRMYQYPVRRPKLARMRRHLAACLRGRRS
jgi:predicted aconitase